jgi:hypothetical protein
MAEAKKRWSVIGWVTKILLFELLRASEGTLSRWFLLHLQSLRTNPHCIKAYLNLDKKCM